MLHASMSDTSAGMRQRSSVATTDPFARDTDVPPPFSGNQARLRAHAKVAAGMLRPSRSPMVQRQCACGGTCASCNGEKQRIQAKLEIGSIDDPLEREADSIADHVMRASDGTPAPAVARFAQHKISRQPAGSIVAYDSVIPPEEEEEIEAEASAPTPMQRSATGGTTSIPPHFERTLDSRIAAGGERLPPQVGAFMSGQFGRDFADVRIHRDAAADDLARNVSARAFTVGKDIFFGRNTYRPESREGRHLIAHELAHVVQQNASAGTVAREIQRQPAAPTCASYPGYDASVDISKYNCAGLALRTYKDISPSSVVLSQLAALHPDGQSQSCDKPCAAAQIKYWLWDYDMETADAKGTPVAGSQHRDFHIVAGITDLSGNDPTDVYSKNGHRPVHGTGTGPSFRPAAFAKYLSNDASEAPVPGVFVNRKNMIDSCFCTGC